MEPLLQAVILTIVILTVSEKKKRLPSEDSINEAYRPLQGNPSKHLDRRACLPSVPRTEASDMPPQDRGWLYADPLC